MMSAFLRALASVARPFAGAIGAAAGSLIDHLKDPGVSCATKISTLVLAGFCLALLALGAMQL